MSLRKFYSCKFGPYGHLLQTLNAKMTELQNFKVIAIVL